LSKPKDWRKYYPYSLERQRACTNNAFRRKYGVSLERYMEMGFNQNWRCYICKIHQSNLTRALAIDHNHITKKVRALLCPKCNWKVGFVETVEAERIKDYIKFFAEVK
jgi:hypothetical protein